MGRIRITTRAGAEFDITGEEGCSVMEIIRDAGVDDVLALCGGCRSCATCHVYVDPAFTEALPPMSDEEDQLLEGADFRTAHSRLSCQIPYTAELEGLRITIAPE